MIDTEKSDRMGGWDMKNSYPQRQLLSLLLGV